MSGRAFAAAAALSFAALAVLTLVLTARPLATDDLWFHLKMGEVYASQGPWPEADPLLHTAHEDAPVQHEWLFGVAVHTLERAVGFHGLRVVHALAVAAILWLVFSIFWRETRSVPAACLGACLFIAVAWWRLFQFRPDLVSIPAALGLYRLLIESDAPPSKRQLAASGALVLVWANAHSLFLLGPLLLFAALLGCGLRAALERVAGAEGAAAAGALGNRRRAAGIAAAIAVGLGLGALNPRGFAHHLTFLTSSESTGIWAVRGEWTHFDPFAYGHYGPAVSPLAFGVTDALLGLFALTAGIGIARFVRRPGRDSLAALDPVRLGLAAASALAIFASIRFQWLLVFPLLFVFRAQRQLLGARFLASTPARAALAAACLALALSFPSLGGFSRAAAALPAALEAYLARPYHTRKYHAEGVRFLADAELEGNLFNAYGMGGFLGYWLSPRLRTFVDGRTGDYPPAVLLDYFMTNRKIGSRPGESFLDTLDRRNVDVFFGVGLPLGRGVGDVGVYTTPHLESEPGWLLVHRALDHAVYLRRGPRNRENLARVAAYYERAGIDFDPERGLDVGALVHSHADWAAAHGVLPPGFPELLRARSSPDREVRTRALDSLGLIYALLGLYAEQLAIDREAAALRPRAKAPRRRMVWGLLRLGEADEAREVARALRRLDPADLRSAQLERVAASLAEGGPGVAQNASRVAHDAALVALPLLTREERRRLSQVQAEPSLR